MQINLNLAAFVRWEQLSNRSFATLDYGDEDDLLRLLYCACNGNVEGKHPFERFVTVLKRSPEELASAIRELQEQNAFVAQFQRNNPEEQAPSSDEDPERLGAIVSRLIIQGGMPPQYVLEEMPLQDLSMYAEALSEKFKQEQEQARLWTFIQIQPHIEKGKIKTPKDLYRFPWEERAIAARAADELKHLRETATEFNDRLRTAKWGDSK